MINNLFKVLNLLLLCLMINAMAYAQKKYFLKSPDSRIVVSLNVGKTVTYTLDYDQKELLVASEIGLDIANLTRNNTTFKVKSVKYKSQDVKIISPLYRQKDFAVKWNEIDLVLDGEFGIVFRTYNDGVAYRIYHTGKTGFELRKEIATFNFAKDFNVFVAHSTSKTDQFAMAFQNTYEYVSVSKALDSVIAFLPVAVDLEDGRKMVITESDVEGYPGMFLEKRNDAKGFNGLFAGYPSEKVIDSRRYMEKVKSRLPIVAKMEPGQKLPWRVMALTDDDRKLPINNLVYALASPSRIKDISWIKPGKSAWDWWNNWGLTGVDFKSGINTATYKYFIDFAAVNKLEYIIMDEGWSPTQAGDIMKVIPEINMQEIIDYGKQKGVGVFIWAVANVLDSKLEQACSYYAKMGVKGFKIDFIDRDDQDANNMIYRIAAMAAKYKLMIDFHGVAKPTGLNRTYPNVLNFESVFGMEEMKWSKKDMPQYDVTMPFIRMMAGPVDYTQGAMKNAAKLNFRDVYYSPMSQGTRAHQLGTYIVFDSPFVMLSDSPTAYMKEQECTDFIASLPVVFDETRILSGKLGEYIITARRSGNDWYIGGLTNWTARTLSVDLTFLKGEYEIDLFKDGLNADKLGEDYKRQGLLSTDNQRINIELAPGGGFAMKLIKHK